MRILLALQISACTYEAVRRGWQVEPTELERSADEASEPPDPSPPPVPDEPVAAEEAPEPTPNSATPMHPVMQTFPALGLSPAPLPQSLDPLHSLVSDLPHEQRGSFLNCVLSLLLHVSQGGSLPNLHPPTAAADDLAAEVEVDMGSGSSSPDGVGGGDVVS